LADFFPGFLRREDGGVGAEEEFAGVVAVEDGDGSAIDELVVGAKEDVYPQLCFVAVPDPKDGKNRLHLDLTPDNQDAEVERLLDMGARHVDIGQGRSVTWVVLADPEARGFLREQMEEFLFSEEGRMPEGWAPEAPAKGGARAKGGAARRK